MQIGQKLYNTVFDVNIRSLFEASRQRARAEGKRLRIRLCLTEVPELARLPWESMYNTSSEHFFACSIETPIVRYLATSYDNGQRNTTLPLRMLVISASPRNFDAKDIEQQWRTIQSSVRVLQDQGVLHVEYLRDITIQRLQARLRREKYDIIHFIGHGEFNDSSQNGTLFFLTDQGNVKTVTGNVLGALLYDAAPTLRLVILNACDGARANSRHSFSGVAQHLVQKSIPMVIAMQSQISVQAATKFSEIFYQSLIDGYPVDAALTEARKSLWFELNTMEWAIPVLFMRTSDGYLLDAKSLSSKSSNSPAPSTRLAESTLPPRPILQMNRRLGGNSKDEKPSPNLRIKKGDQVRQFSIMYRWGKQKFSETCSFLINDCKIEFRMLDHEYGSEPSNPKCISAFRILFGEKVQRCKGFERDIVLVSEQKVQQKLQPKSKKTNFVIAEKGREFTILGKQFYLRCVVKDVKFRPKHLNRPIKYKVFERFQLDVEVIYKGKR